MGATVVGLWAGVDCALRYYCRHVRHCVLQGLQGRDSIYRRRTIYPKPHFQFLFYLFSIWPQKQFVSIHRHPPRPRHPSLGTLCSLPILTHQPYLHRRPQPRVDYLRQHPVSPMGLHRDSFAVNNYVHE